MVQSFAASLDIDETLNVAIERFIQYLDAEAAFIFLMSDNGEQLCAGVVPGHWISPV